MKTLSDYSIDLLKALVAAAFLEARCFGDQNLPLLSEIPRSTSRRVGSPTNPGFDEWKGRKLSDGILCSLPRGGD